MLRACTPVKHSFVPRTGLVSLFSILLKIGMPYLRIELFLLGKKINSFRKLPQHGLSRRMVSQLVKYKMFLNVITSLYQKIDMIIPRLVGASSIVPDTYVMSKITFPYIIIDYFQR